MDAKALDFLKKLLHTPSPSGYEQEIQQVVRDYVKDFADEVKTDVHGSVVAVCNPGAKLRVMLAGHCDQIGFLVQHIDDNGFLFVSAVGGWDPVVLVGQALNVWTKNGPVPGVVSRKPIHLLTDEDRGKALKLKDLWVDIGAKDKAEADETVQIGDPITVRLSYTETRNDLAFAPGMDDKTGLWVVMEALRRVRQKKLACSLYAVSTVQEEVGLRGARTSSFGIDPHVGVAVDVTHATDCPGIEKKTEGDIALGRGPVIYRGPNMNPRVVERLIETAKAGEIPYQLAADSRATGTDANAIQVNRAGVAAGLVSIPNRYMHSPVEMVSLKDIDRAADLLAGMALRLKGDENFIP